MKYLILISVFALLIIPNSYSQNETIEDIKAQEEFRRGVNAFNSGFYNESILSFLKSISFRSENPLVHEWLGRAYYFSGLEEAAVNEWRSVLEVKGDPVLRTFLEAVAYRRSGGAELDSLDRYVTVTSLPGLVEGVDVFNRPSGVDARRDGWFYVAAYGSNEILHIDANGVLRGRYQGGLTGLNRPFDTVLGPDGFLYVTEFRGDRISKLNSRGLKELVIGRTGINPGELLGPQFITLDDKNQLYVTEYGNRRVSKFKRDGSFVLTFGERGEVFQGFREPTGIAAIGSIIYVADKKAGEIYQFDENGNYQGSLGANTLMRPEGIAKFDDNHLLVTDADKLLLLNTTENTVSLFADTADFGTIVKAVIGPNGTVYATDFQENAVHLLSEMTDLYTNLIVQVGRVNADNFPSIAVDVTVQDRAGNGIIGLNKSNFTVTDGNLVVNDLEMTYAEDKTETVDVMILAERSKDVIKSLHLLEEGANEIAGAVSERGVVGLTVTSPEPFIAEPFGKSVLEIASKARLEGNYSERWRLDSGIRLAGSELIKRDGRKGIIFIGNGGIMGDQLIDYDLPELASYLQNNGIVFYGVLFNGASESPELEFLASETGGYIQPIHDARGVTSIVSHLLNKTSGTYQLTYTSGSPADFGRSFIPLEIQTIYLRRSGRGKGGYFAPLEF